MAAVDSPTPPVDFQQLSLDLEAQELESAGGVASAQVYGQLLALYLLQNDVVNAKFLWKRIPQSIKTANVELALIWAIGQNMWQRDFPKIYENLKQEWSEPMKPIIEAITEATRKRALMLVAQAYSSIKADECAAYAGLPVNETVDVVVEMGWTADPHSRMITPKKIDKPEETIMPSEQQMNKLTEYVSVLES
ncbi:hypothetical protein CAPTEDRAFT_154607 [Capitella teleta]|uniref:COP9 signalosome complex subunit 8 n=1 Tax=Capitella teleta TaxID=283909 RepID=R7TP68_CAPTE|nr:hypothetical protein CAPTEDRAFT_154607 [Capitella teleta]|eukprot:ELT95352.1 hypothetical protein CAPTEDRAFT_154607 [Capitella teleta]